MDERCLREQTCSAAEIPNYAEDRRCAPCGGMTRIRFEGSAAFQRPSQPVAPLRLLLATVKRHAPASRRHPAAFGQHAKGRELGGQILLFWPFRTRNREAFRANRRPARYQVDSSRFAKTFESAVVFGIYSFVWIIRGDVAEMETFVWTIRADVAETKTFVRTIRADVVETKTFARIIRADVAETKTFVRFTRAVVAETKTFVRFTRAIAAETKTFARITPAGVVETRECSFSGGLSASRAT
jgi:hypothetical protein